MTKAAVIHSFWSRFGLPAYEENAVPDDAEYPYITYTLVTDRFGTQTALTANLRDRTSSWNAINAKTEEISTAISRGGIILPCEGGAVWLMRGSPFAQSLGDDADKLIRRKYINVTAEYLTAD